MRLFLRRIIIIAVLLVLAYLIYGRANPTGAEKIQAQIEALDLPRSTARENAEQLLIKEVGREDTQEEQEVKETQPEPMRETEETVPEENKEIVENTELDDLRDFLEQELESATGWQNSQGSDPIVAPAPVQQAQVEAEVQVDAELTADELSEIEKLLKSLLED